MNGMAFRTRIAPTPSGFLHAGNAVNFLLAHALAREHEGTLMLRIDDLDVERVRPEYVQDIFDSLEWLGIRPDEGPLDVQDLHLNWSQTDRLDSAHAMLDQLRSVGSLFACTCSRRLSTGCGCRDDDLPFDGKDTAWRLRSTGHGEVTLRELFREPHTLDAAALMPDPVLRQRNGSPSYQVVSLADDVRYGINLIVRGEDLLPSTACQLQIADLLNLRVFLDVRFVHHPLLTDAHGHKLSKSAGAGSLHALRTAGETPDRLREQASRLLVQLRDQGL